MTTTFTPGPVIAIEDRKRPWFVGDEDRLQWKTASVPWAWWETVSQKSIAAGRIWWSQEVTHIRLDITHPESIRRTWNDAHPDEKSFDAVWMGGDRAPDDWDGGGVLSRSGTTFLPASGLSSPWWQDDGQKYDIIAYRRKPAAETVEGAPAGCRLVRTKADDDCGCPEEEWDTPWGYLFMHLNTDAPSDGCLDLGDDGEREIRVVAPTVVAAREAFFAWASMAAMVPAAETETLTPADNAVRIERLTRLTWFDKIQEASDRFEDEGIAMALLRSLDLITPEPTKTDRFMAAHPDADRETAELALKFGEAGR